MTRRRWEDKKNKKQKKKHLARTLFCLPFFLFCFSRHVLGVFRDMYAVVSKSCCQLFVVPYVPYVALHTSLATAVRFPVKQGDVISPILFNAGLQHAMRKWKAKLFHHGVQLGHGNRLTNIRYADDLMLFATSSKDLIYMLETLIPELAACGLQLDSHGYVLIFTDLFFSFCCLFTFFCLHIERYGVKAERTLH